MKPKLILCLALVLSGNCNSAIVYPKAPDGGREMVVKHLDPETLKFLKVSRVEDLTIADPCREYFVGLTNLASRQMLSAARLGGWRYLLIHGTNAVGAAELIAERTNEQALRFNTLDESRFADETLAALRIAEELPKIKKQDYEVRYLNIPAVYFVAVWLHGKSDDILIPLPPTYKRMNAYQPYSESQIIKLLKKEANAVMQEPLLPR